MKRSLLVGAMSLSLLLVGQPAAALMSDWGINTLHGLDATDTFGSARTGTVNGIAYWEELGAGPYWGEVTPGYGGYAYDIAGVYLRVDASSLSIAALVGMPPGGFDGGNWNGTRWATGEHNVLGDIFLSFDGTPMAYEYAMLTTGSGAGSVYYLQGAGTAPTDYPGSAPALVGTAPRVGTPLGQSFSYTISPFAFPDGSGSYYFIEGSMLKPSDFRGAVSFHMTETCGNDLAQFTASVPEPSTLLLLGSGLLGLVGLNRRRSMP